MTEEGQGEPETVAPEGALERVPLKVVPYFVEPAVIEPEPEAAAPAPEPVAVPSRRAPMLGILSLIVAVLTAGAHVTAIVVASDGAFELGTLLGYLAIGLSAVAVVLGIAALIVRRGRRLAAAGIVLGVIANPWVLLWILTAVSS